MTYRECEHCGSALDPGEKCDCTEVNLPAIRCTQPPVIAENLDSVRQNLEAVIAEISVLPLNDDSLKYVKQVRANLAKDFDQLENQRKAVKKQVMEPYEAANKKYQEFIAGPYKDADERLKKWVDGYQNTIKQECEHDLREYFHELCQAQKIDFLDFRFCGVVVDMAMARQKVPRKAIEQIHDRVMAVRADMDTILKMDNAEEIMAEYRKHPVLSQAVTAVENRKKEKQQMTAFVAEQKQAQEQKAQQIAALMEAAPEIQPEPEERYTVAFLATGSMASLKAMKAYGLTLGITFEDIEQEEESNE